MYKRTVDNRAEAGKLENKACTKAWHIQVAAHNAWLLEVKHGAATVDGIKRRVQRRIFRSYRAILSAAEEVPTRVGPLETAEASKYALRHGIGHSCSTRRELGSLLRDAARG